MMLNVALVLAVLAAILGGIGACSAARANKSGTALTEWGKKVQKWEQHAYDCHSDHGAPCPDPVDHVPPPPPPDPW
jgi:hypothetical protein